ncbi:hypothetical protein [Nonomuraea rubra]|uniref:hypothetical protein n=1 Tax=Nonomuraea rubra TaxID=46180 RepID=UPI0031EA2582
MSRRCLTPSASGHRERRGPADHALRRGRDLLGVTRAGGTTVHLRKHLALGTTGADARPRELAAV